MARHGPTEDLHCRRLSPARPPQGNTSATTTHPPSTLRAPARLRPPGALPTAGDSHAAPEGKPYCCYRTTTISAPGIDEP